MESDHLALRILQARRGNSFVVHPRPVPPEEQRKKHRYKDEIDKRFRIPTYI
jgi:hypothetical protein